MSRHNFYILLEDQSLKGDKWDLERFAGPVELDASHILSKIEWHGL